MQYMLWLLESSYNTSVSWKSLRAHVLLHHPFSSSKEYIGCTDCALQDACAALFEKAAPHLCSLQSYGYSLCMRVTVGHLRVSDVTLCSTCCGCSSHPRKSLRAHVPLHHPFSSSKEYIGCLDASIKDENIHLP